MSLRLSRTDLCFIRESARDGSVRLAPLAEGWLASLKSKGLATFTRRPDGWFIATATQKAIDLLPERRAA